jgi:hypothetical protein
MSENRFFQNIQSVMSDYRPEVPQAAYAGMRRKLWWSNFTKISATRFNVWYALLIVSSVTIWFNYSSIKSNPTTEAVSNETFETPNQNLPVPSIHQEQQTSPQAEETASVIIVKQSQEGSPSSVSTNKEVENNEPIVSEKSVTTAPTETRDLNSQSPAKVDTSVAVTKGTKKGLKVKTYQVSDK